MEPDPEAAAEPAGAAEPEPAAARAEAGAREFLDATFSSAEALLANWEQVRPSASRIPWMAITPHCQLSKRSTPKSRD